MKCERYDDKRELEKRYEARVDRSVAILHRCDLSKSLERKCRKRNMSLLASVKNEAGILKAKIDETSLGRTTKLHGKYQKI